MGYIVQMCRERPLEIRGNLLEEGSRPSPEVVVHFGEIQESEAQDGEDNESAPTDEQAEQLEN